MPAEFKDNFQIGTKCVIVADCDLRGDVTLGSGTILQPRCTILAMSGPIILGSNNIVEENVVIVNRLKQPMVIGDSNLFEVGARIESPSIGSHNSFGIRSRISPHVSVGSHCSIGPGCIVLPSPFPLPLPLPPSPSTQVDDDDTPGDPARLSSSNDDAAASRIASALDSPTPTNRTGEARTAGTTTLPPPSAPRPLESLANYTHVFGSENRRRTVDPRRSSTTGSGRANVLSEVGDRGAEGTEGDDEEARTNGTPTERQGQVQARALFVKHWEYLRETLPRYHKLKMF
ncbi:hypothetical protein JCM10212_004423 [Sporobolomyces blumeae]